MTKFHISSLAFALAIKTGPERANSARSIRLPRTLHLDTQHPPCRSRSRGGSLQVGRREHGQSLLDPLRDVHIRPCASAVRRCALRCDFGDGIIQSHELDTCEDLGFGEHRGDLARVYVCACVVSSQCMFCAREVISLPLSLPPLGQEYTHTYTPAASLSLFLPPGHAYTHTYTHTHTHIHTHTYTSAMDTRSGNKEG